MSRLIPVSFLIAGQNTGLVTWGTPIGYTMVGPEQIDANGEETEIAIAYLIKASAGATGAISWNNADGDGNAE